LYLDDKSSEIRILLYCVVVFSSVLDEEGVFLCKIRVVFRSVLEVDEAVESIRLLDVVSSVLAAVSSVLVFFDDKNLGRRNLRSFSEDFVFGYEIFRVDLCLGFCNITVSLAGANGVRGGGGEEGGGGGREEVGGDNLSEGGGRY